MQTRQIRLKIGIKQNKAILIQLVNFQDPQPQKDEGSFVENVNFMHHSLFNNTIEPRHQSVNSAFLISPILQVTC